MDKENGPTAAAPPPPRDVDRYSDFLMVMSIFAGHMRSLFFMESAAQNKQHETLLDELFTKSKADVQKMFAARRRLNDPPASTD